SSEKNANEAGYGSSTILPREQLGKASRWVEIYQLNRDRLGDKLEHFRPGITLLLPEAAVSSQAAGNVLRQ
ncbi:hypothetical protein, partial [Thermogutta sp.]|uniref:hypothetical protein n=1 Tax=Thermogutta sp. TaxID=1962930 RepID=UPI003C79B15C